MEPSLHSRRNGASAGATSACRSWVGLRACANDQIIASSSGSKPWSFVNMLCLERRAPELCCKNEPFVKLMTSDRFEILENLEIADIQELKKFWKQTIDRYFTPRTLCLLKGALGAGKTESLKQIYQLFGFQDSASPSFAIHHRAQNPRGQTLDHVDLYRLNDYDDLEST